MPLINMRSLLLLALVATAPAFAVEAGLQAAPPVDADCVKLVAGAPAIPVPGPRVDQLANAVAGDSLTIAVPCGKIDL